MVISPTAADGGEAKLVVAVVEQAVTKAKGKIKNQEELGEKPLAYAIAGHQQAVFNLFEMKVAADKVKTLNNQLSNEKGILRYLLIKREEK